MKAAEIFVCIILPILILVALVTVWRNVYLLWREKKRLQKILIYRRAELVARARLRKGWLVIHEK